MYYTPNERGYFYLSSDIFHFEKKCGIQKLVSKNVFFCLLFLIVHISASFVIGGLKFGKLVTHIGVEGIVSQIFVLCLSFHFMPKNG